MTFVLEDTPDGVDLVVTGDWSSKARDALSAGKANGLDLNYAKGFRERDLRFLEGLPLRRLRILSRTMSDLTPLYSLSETLESLSVQTNPRTVIELERLPRLRNLSASWSQIRGSIAFLPHLRRLFVLGYAESDLTPLATLSELVSLVMKDYPHVRSLDGMGDLSNLTELGVHLARGLEDISSLRAGPWLLSRLQLSHCRRIPDIGPVAGCPALELLDFSECGDIPSVKPLTGLTRLEGLHLWGSTKVLDGDLRPVASLSNLRDFKMQSRPPYSPSVKDIQDAIKVRLSG